MLGSLVQLRFATSRTALWRCNRNDATGNCGYCSDDRARAARRHAVYEQTGSEANMASPHRKSNFVRFGTFWIWCFICWLFRLSVCAILVLVAYSFNGSKFAMVWSEFSAMVPKTAGK